MAILPYPVAPPKNPQQKAQEPKKASDHLSSYMELCVVLVLILRTVEKVEDKRIQGVYQLGRRSCLAEHPSLVDLPGLSPNRALSLHPRLNRLSLCLIFLVALFHHHLHLLR